LSRKQVHLKKSVVISILEYAAACHPREGILLLRGRINGGSIVVEEVEVPPLSIQGVGFSSFQPYMLPIDFSIIGTAHSHPSGILEPSATDINRFYGRIMVIAAYPYRTEKDLAIFDSEGRRLRYKIID